MKRKLKTFLLFVLVMAIVLIIFSKIKNPTHYFLPFGKTSSPVSLVFVGDIMLDRSVSKHARKFGTDSLFSKVENIFKGKDIVVGNLEGTITTNPSISEVDNSILRFTFDPLYAELLKKINFSTFSLANNHSLDFGNDGYNQTISNLEKVGLGYFGSARNDENLSTKIEIKGKTICLVGYHDLYFYNEKPAIEEIKRIKNECSLVVVFSHWGEEYIKTPNQRQRALAHTFVDAGADLVIGAHPHVIQPIEVYKNRAIFYSLGNFIFDQDFSVATSQGLVVDLELNSFKNENHTTFTLIFTSINNKEVEIMDQKNSDKVIEQLIALSVDSNLMSEVLGREIIENKKFTLYLDSGPSKR